MLLDFPVPSEDSEKRGGITYITQEQYDKHIDNIQTKLDNIKKTKNSQELDRILQHKTSNSGLKLV